MDETCNLSGGKRKLDDSNVHGDDESNWHDVNDDNDGGGDYEADPDDDGDEPDEVDSVSKEDSGEADHREPGSVSASTKRFGRRCL